MLTIAMPMTDGFKETEIAAQLGRTASWVSERLSELRQEILHQNGLLPPLSGHDYQALRESIRSHGIHNAIIIGEHLPIVDGLHRAKISVELGIPCPALFLDGYSRGEEHEIGVALNASRRQLNRQQRRKLIESELARDPERSDRRVAGVCGAHHQLVATIRRDMIEQARLWFANALPAREAPRAPSYALASVDDSSTSAPETRYAFSYDHLTVTNGNGMPPLAQPRRSDTLGRLQPASKPPRPPKPGPVHACPHCQQPIAVRGHGSKLRLEAAP